MSDKKNIPVKPTIRKGWVTSDYGCPVCGWKSFENMAYGRNGNEAKYCPKCGQAFDWDLVSDDELKVVNRFVNH